VEMVADMHTHVAYRNKHWQHAS